MFDPLILDPAPTDLWLAFQAEPRALTGHGGIVAHWQRSRALGASPDGPRPEDALERGAALRDRTESLDALIARGRGVLERIAAVAHEHDYSLLLADADGVVLKAMGGGGFAAAARQVRLIEGAHWGEQTRGTNAIGTALAEQRPVFVRGSAHYARSYHELVCYAAPVRGPDGSIVGVLDATSVFDRDDRSMGFGVVAAALALEEVLRAHSFGRAGAQVVRALSRTLEHVATPAVLVVPPGRIARCNGAARELLGPHGVRAGLRQVLGLSFAELAAMAGRDGLCCTVGPRRAPMRLHVDPIESEGALIAALVLLEPVQRVSSSPAPPPVRAVAAGGAFDALFAADAATRAALVFARKVAPSELPIMLLAETGSGKELVAQGIHRASGRGDRPFVAVNCGSIQPTLLESELFGYGPGAFTGAERRGHDGYLAAAGAGTLFLDEVAEMPLAMQAALLRVLETRSYRRVGETELRPAHCRIVCATCRDLPALVAAGQFRRDLYFRLRGATVTLPPLRRRSDIAALARHLLERVAETRGIVPTPQLDVAVVRHLERATWPGNVRELKTLLEVALVLADGASRIGLEHLPDSDRGASDSRIDVSAAAAASCEDSAGGLADVEAAAVRRALNDAAGNVSRAAAALGIARSTLYRMMRRHGLRAE